MAEQLLCLELIKLCLINIGMFRVGDRPRREGLDVSDRPGKRSTDSCSLDIAMWRLFMTYRNRVNGIVKQKPVEWSGREKPLEVAGVTLC